MKSAVDTREREDGGYRELLVRLRGCAIARREERRVLSAMMKFVVLMLEVGVHLNYWQLEMRWNSLQSSRTFDENHGSQWYDANISLGFISKSRLSRLAHAIASQLSRLSIETS